MRCATCGLENRPTAKFCDGCGSALALVCSACGAVARASARFCDECGTALKVADTESTVPVGGAELAPPASEPVAERRLCSILFVDLVGFTTLSESRDPEEVREILSHYFELARRTIALYGGVVEKFIGDAVMAVWGTPIAREGDTERAVRAALDLVAAVASLGHEIGAVGLAARAGVVTGEVAVTIGADGEGMVAGDAVNTASRVQSVAAQGTVFVDDATRRLCEPAIAFRDEGSFTLKGKEEPEQLFAATRVVSGVGGNQWADGGEAPFTGRDAELRAIKDFFHSSVDRKTPHLAVITGSAGVGKSRLGWEFEKYIDGLADTVLWHRGRCLSYGEGVAFWALSEIVRQRFGVAEEDPSELAAMKLKEGLVRFVANDAERDYVGIRLSRLLGIPYPSETKAVLSQDELYAGWRLFFENLAAVAPVVLVVEDAQHADESLLGFFAHLIDWSRDKPIFVLLFARPGHTAIDAGYGVGRNRSTLSLDPLDATSMGNLVDALVPGIPSVARDAITDRAQGIPLFAVETVRSLIDQGVVRQDADSYRLVGDLAALRVPDSLHSLLAARLDALPPEARVLVAEASVVGTTFPREALVAVSRLDAPVVDSSLAELVRRDVLDIVADPLSPERGSYRFSQEMLRQVAYDTLSKRDRKTRHLAVAAHLRTVFPNDGEEIADAIARHFLDALAASHTDTDTDDIRTDALAFLVRAAQRAVASGAPSRAAQVYAQAAEIAAPDRSPSLFEEAARASDDAGEYARAVFEAEAARTGYLALGDLRGAARAQSVGAGAQFRNGHFVAATRALTEALEILRERPDADTVTALRYLAAIEPDVDEARQLVTEALDLAQALGVSERELALLFNTRAIRAVTAGRMVEAASDLREAARLAERAGDYGTLGMAEVNLADVLQSTDPRTAAEAARSAIAHARRTGRRGIHIFATTNLAAALIDLGEWDAAAKVLRDALEVDHLDRSEVHALAGLLAALRGDKEGAVGAQRAVADERDSEDPQTQTALGTLDAFAALCGGDVPGALLCGLAVLDRADGVGIAADWIRRTWALAARAARDLNDAETLERLVAMLDARPIGHLPPLLRAEGELVGSLLAADAEDPVSPAAGSRVAAAVEMLREVGDPYQLAHGLIDLAEVLRRADEPGLDAALSEARAIAERLGCSPLALRASSVDSPRAADSTGEG